VLSNPVLPVLFVVVSVPGSPSASTKLELRVTVELVTILLLEVMLPFTS